VGSSDQIREEVLLMAIYDVPELLERVFADNAPDAYEQLARIFFWAARRKGLSESDAEDLVHDTLCGVCESWPRFCDLPSEDEQYRYPWGIFKRALSDWYRKSRLLSKGGTEEAELCATDKVQPTKPRLPEAEQVEGYVAEVVCQSLRLDFEKIRVKSTGPHRQGLDALWAHVWEGRSYEEFAAARGMSAGTLRPQVWRALQYLKQELERDA